MFTTIHYLPTKLIKEVETYRSQHLVLNQFKFREVPGYRYKPQMDLSDTEEGQVKWSCLVTLFFWCKDNCMEEMNEFVHFL